MGSRCGTNPRVMRRSTAIAAGLGLISAQTLLLELAQIRVFSYSLHPLIAYSAIALAMLGFGLGATLLTVFPRLSGEDPVRRAAHASLALAGVIFGVNLLFATISPNVIPVATLQVSKFWTSMTLLPCILPYVISGFLVTLLLQLEAERVGKLYFWNLLGSGVGCVVAMVLLRPLGAERLVLLSAAAAAGCAVVFALPGGGRLRWIAAGAMVFGLGLTPFAPRVLQFKPDSNDLLYVYAAQHHASFEREYTAWDPVGRIDVLRHDIPRVQVTEPVDYRTITNDSGAMALLLAAPSAPGTWGKAIFEQTIYAVPYLIKKDPEVLVIGVGGGIDIHTALHWNAKRVVGVEVSGATMQLLNGPYASFTRWKEQGDRVRLLHGDGRSFARSTTERFDIVQLSGVDTFTVHSASAMVTAEDYLYTVDAFEDFLGLLKDDGVLAVTRFGDEAMNLSTIAAEALRRAGVTHPERHIFAVQQSYASGILVKKAPLTEAEIDKLKSIEDRRVPTGVRVPHYDEVGLRAGDPLHVLHPTGRDADPRYQFFFAAMGEGQETTVLREIGNPFIAPTDDRPYYMLLGIWFASSKLIHPVIGTLRVATLLIASTSLTLILLPLVRLRRRSGAGLGTLAAVALYFFGLGASFMLLEVGLIHRTIVFVGSPGASVSVVMASILVSSGVGARVSDVVRWQAWRRLVFAMAGLAGVGLFYRFAAGSVFDALFGLPVWGRCVLAALLLAPAGFFAGWFFPVGLGLVARKSTALVPWAIAVNGFASVLGSLATLSLGVSFGFQMVFTIALVGYAIAVAALIPLARKAA